MTKLDTSREDRLEEGLIALYRRRDMSDKERDLLIDVLNDVGWDDAIHIAAPWERRSSLCGNWNRNLVSIDAPRPDGWEGCWTCLMAAGWLDQNLLDPPIPWGECWWTSRDLWWGGI